MSEWLRGDGWRYHALSAGVFVIVAGLIALSFALLTPGMGGIYVIGTVALLIVYPFAARKHIFWPPPNSMERAVKRAHSRRNPPRSA